MTDLCFFTTVQEASTPTQVYKRQQSHSSKNTATPCALGRAIVFDEAPAMLANVR